VIQSFPPGVDIEVPFSFVDLNGNAVEPVSLELRVYNEAGSLVHSASPSLTPDSTETTVIVPGSVNALPSGQAITARQVELRLILATGYVTVTSEYVVRTIGDLAVPTESFVTYLQAVTRGMTLPNLLAWENATRDQRIAALGAAYQRLTRFTYAVWKPEDADVQSRLVPFEDVIQPRRWPTISEQQFAALSERFRIAIASAQLVEANEILTGDIIGDKQRAGVLSETIGESSMMFRSMKQLEKKVSKSSYGYISSYVITPTVRIGRA